MGRIGRTDLSRLARPRAFFVHTGIVAVLGVLALVVPFSVDLSEDRSPVPLTPGVWIMLALVSLDGVYTALTRRGLYIPGAMPSIAITFGLLLVHGWQVAALWQAVPVLISGLIRHDSWWRVGYTMGHYVIAFVAADLVLGLFRIEPGPETPRALQVADFPRWRWPGSPSRASRRARDGWSGRVGAARARSRWCARSCGPGRSRTAR